MHTLPKSDSIICPIVIRDGIACGFMIRSGRRPSAVNGIFSSGMISPIVPFCPDLDANLSPCAGNRSSRTLTFATLNPSSPCVINDLSTNPNCPFLGFTESSVHKSLLSTLDVIFPIKIILSLSSVFSLIIPLSSSIL